MVHMQRYLMESEENELEAFLLGCAQIGYGKTRSEVLLIVQKTLKERSTGFKWVVGRFS